MANIGWFSGLFEWARCTCQLGLLGAEAIKTGLPGQGDWFRAAGSDPELRQARMRTYFLSRNTGKRSVTVNMKDGRGRDIVRKLVERRRLRFS